jgi:subtilisin family serine protease
MRRWLWAAAFISLFMTVALARTGSRDVIVRLKPGHSIDQLNGNLNAKTVRRLRNRPVYLIRVEDGDEKVLDKVRAELSVQRAEANPRVRLDHDAPPVYVSPTLGQDMATLLDGRTLTTFNGSTVLKAYVDQPAVRLARIDEVRSISTGAGTRVGYIDTGIDPDHPALKPWVEPGVDLISSGSVSEFAGLSQDMAALLDQNMAARVDQDMAALLDSRMLFLLNRSMASILSGGTESTGFPAAWGHGTLVAGIIHLVAPDARIVPIKAFDADGNTTMFTLIEAIYSAIEQKVDVLNMSFSLSEDSRLFSYAVAYAQARGITIVSSVGNDGRNEKDLYPAAYSTVYGVAATDFNDRLATFSNYGKSVSISAPGSFVVSTVPGGRYAAAWGTSFSAPIVSGGIALLASKRGHGHSDPQSVFTTADSIDDLNPGFENKLGTGRINLYRALTR